MTTGMRISALALALVLTGLAHAAEPVPRVDFGMPLEPEGTVLNGAGQNLVLGHVALAEALGPESQPAFHMVDAGLRASPEQMQERLEEWARMLDFLAPEVGLQVGVSFVHRNDAGDRFDYGDAIVAGEHDPQIERLAQRLADLDRPVWVRIGDECNGFWNGYRPATYRAAFAHIARIFRRHLGDRVATVWCTHPIDDLDELLEYYPGDEWVDWWSIDLFQPEFLRRDVVRAFCRTAAEHRRPVLIGACTPSEVPGAGEDKWNAWYAPFFAIVHGEPNVKGISYINRNWGVSRWDWGDARVHTDPELLYRYRAELQRPLYRHAQRPPPAGRRIDPLPLPSPSDRVTLGPGDAMPLRLPASLEGHGQLFLTARPLGADGRPLEDAGRVTLTVVDAADGATLARRSLRARSHPLLVRFELPRLPTRIRVELHAVSGAAAGVRILGGRHPQAVAAQVLSVPGD